MKTLNLNDFDEVIIFQFGKVASQTLFHTFKKLIPTRHHHNFAEVDAIINTRTRSVCVNPECHWYDIVCLDKLCRQCKIPAQMKTFPEKCRRLIINVTRNIFERNMSMFFQNMENPYSPIYFDGDREDLQSLLIFYKEINTKEPTQYASGWYDRFNSVVELNIFEDDFDFENKYMIKNNEDITVLVIRFEDMGDWEPLLSKIFNQPIKLTDSNKTDMKPYYDLYKNFKAAYKFSDYEIDVGMGMNFMNHFYTEDELTDFKKKLA